MLDLGRERVIRIIPVLALLIVLYVLVQVLVVPFWDKGVEAAYIDVAYGDMTTLQSDIEDVTEHDTQKSCTVQLGARYQNRILFFNPWPGAAGSITVEPVGITGSYTASEAYTYPINYNSSRIIYGLNGMINSPKLVYEHGIIIWDWGAEGNVTADTQSLINVDTGNVHIPVVNASPGTTSGLAAKTFDICPYSTTPDCTESEFVTITLDTNYPTLWRDLLSDYIKAGLVSVSNQTKTITICSSALPYISLPAQPAQEAEVSAGIITCSKEVPPGAVLTIPAAISWNATAGKNVTVTQTSTQTSTSSLTVTRTPAPTLTGRVFGGGGGGGGGGGVVIKEEPKVSTEDATSISDVSATLNMAFDFNDYDSVQVQFKYKEGEELEWDGTGWVSRTGSGSQCYSETIVTLSANRTYYFLALLLYDTTEIEGVENSFVTLTPTPTATPTLVPTSPPTPRPTVKPSPTPRSRPAPSFAPRPTIRLKPRPML